VNIGGVEIGQGQPCRFVAEISNNANGKFDNAIRLIDAAKAAGADFVKFQCYTADELVALRGDGPAPEPWGAQGWTMRTLYERAATPLEWFPALFQHARDIGIVPFSSVFGLGSLVVLEKCACPAYKIAKMENGQSGLIEAVHSRNKPVLMSTSEASFGKAGWMFYRAHTMYCPGGYPCDPADVRLPNFGGDIYSQHSHIGLSSHCMDPLLPIAAVARGCKLIEMHFMLDDEPSELEANVSLTASQFGNMVKAVRRVEQML
jgi:sialic acid synthase SpsE